MNKVILLLFFYINITLACMNKFNISKEECINSKDCTCNWCADNGACVDYAEMKKINCSSVWHESTTSQVCITRRIIILSIAVIILMCLIAIICKSLTSYMRKNNNRTIFV